MSIEITVPRFGWNMESGIFRGWLKRDGDPVRSGDAIFSLEGDKAVQDVEAIDEGVLRIPANGPKEGDTVAVGAVIAFLEGASGQSGTAPRMVRQESPGEIPSPKRVSLPERATSAKPASSQVASPAVRRLARAMAVDLANVTGTGIGGRIDAGDLKAKSPTRPPAIDVQFSSPRARRTARLRGVDLAAIQGTGRGGRIRERDVLALSAGEALSPMRQAIADRLSHTWQTTVPVTLTTTADVSKLVEYRDGLKNVGPDTTPTFTDFFIALTAQAIQHHPTINARWVGERLDVSAGIHIGLAVDTPAGLLVPVIRDVANHSLTDIVTKTRELAEKARSRTLQASDMQGGTFTLSNLGKYGIDAFTPILNWPEIAILGIGRITQQPAVIENQIAIRDIVTLSLTFDHRAIDGAPAAAFLQTLVKLIENAPTQTLV